VKLLAVVEVKAVAKQVKLPSHTAVQHEGVLQEPGPWGLVYGICYECPEIMHLLCACGDVQMRDVSEKIHSAENFAIPPSFVCLCAVKAQNEISVDMLENEAPQ